MAGIHPIEFDTESFEFERKFYVESLPQDLLKAAGCDVIVQSYLFARDGYAVRIRITFTDEKLDFPRFDEATDYRGAYERKLLSELMARAGSDREKVRAHIAVKSPTVGAQRYEFEREIDLDVAVQILRRCDGVIVKNRFSTWIDEDGWQCDVFSGENAGLIVAEVERAVPVTNLKIPSFCVSEVSEDMRFTNDHLSIEPFARWGAAFKAELEVRGPHFMDLEG
ncbi:MAG: adenylate cyclase [Actinomycetaceae bacterium]|nr:adenylate cyclase [Actinomycetaceae bacterium]MDY6082461.1 adenylate cyclase [Actinomycetaceae bacterium]